MTTSSAVFCPDCNAEVSGDLRTCAECGADLGRWTESQRTPLILPGNPALSADVVRKRVSVPKMVGGAVLTSVVVGSVLYYMPEKQVDDRQTAVAVAGPRMAPDANDLPVSRDVELPPTAVPETAPTASAAAYSAGDAAIARTVTTPAPPVAAPIVTRPAPVTTAAPAPAARVAAAPARPTPTATTPTTSVPTTPAPRPVASAGSVLRMLPLVSNTLRPGERLQLRWSVTDRRTRRAVPARIEFTSTDASIITVNSSEGVVVARAPGTASVIVDGGAAGQTTVRIYVRAPAASQVVTVAPAPATEPPRVTSVPPAPSTTTTNTAPPMTVPVLTPARDMPTADEVRTVVDRFIRDVRSGSVRNFELMQFLRDGADHNVRLVGGPSTTRSTTFNIRVAFDLRLSKYDGGGRPVTRIASITMDVEKRDGTATSSAINIGPLLRP
ncbi:MAG: hypothetical protein V4813_05835 [Gemmatimonadota bacterium]